MSINQPSPFSTVWSGLDDIGLRPVAICALTPSGYRPLNASEFGGGGGGSGSTTVTVGAVGVTGSTGLALEVVRVSGFNAIPVYIVSGQGAGGGGASSSIQGTAASGTSGSMPNPVVIGGVVNTNGNRVFPEATLQPFRLDAAGNLYATLGTTLTSALDSVSVAQTGQWKIGITGATGLQTDVVSAGGYSSIPVIITSGNTNISRVSSADRSGTITGVTSQSVVGSNSNRNGFLFQNISTSALAINFGSAASFGPGSIILLPTGSYEMPAHTIDISSIDVIGTVSGQTWTAKEW